MKKDVEVQSQRLTVFNPPKQETATREAVRVITSIFRVTPIPVLQDKPSEMQLASGSYNGELYGCQNTHAPKSVKPCRIS